MSGSGADDRTSGSGADEGADADQAEPVIEYPAGFLHIRLSCTISDRCSVWFSLGILSLPASFASILSLQLVPP